MVTDRILDALHRNFGQSGYENFSAHDFLHAEGSAKNAILYSTLFFPEFIEVDGVVLLKMNVADQVNLDRFRLLKASEKQSQCELEKSFNFLEIAYCFCSGRDQLKSVDEELLAELVAESWKCHLKGSFPHRNFIVRVCRPGEISDVFAVCFEEIR